MKAVIMFKHVCSLALVLACVLLLVGSPQAADAQSTPTIASDTQTPTNPSTTFDSVEVVQGGKVLKLRADGAAVDVQSDTHSLYLHSAGKGNCPHACNNVLINPFGGEGNVGIGTIEPGHKLDVNGRVRVRQGANDLSAGIFFYQKGPQADRSFVGMSDDTHVGFYGIGGIGWGLLMNTSNGDVTVSGKTTTKVLQITGGADLAESFAIAEVGAIIPGQIVSIDADHPGALRIADSAYDRTVAGVISGAGGINPGLTLQQEGSVAEGAYPVSLTGRVYVWADAAYGSIAPGDLLTTSDTPGHAMKVTDYERAKGAILGKAMGSLNQGKGLVLVLVTLQ